jgi:2'-5' RNA ligase
MTTQTHYFVAVPLPQNVKTEFSTYMKKIKNDFPFTRWVHPEDLHITLAFLGNVEPKQLDLLNPQLKEAAARHATFTLSLSELGTFGNRQSPRIFWYGVEKSQPLNDLRDDIFTACERIGISLDTRPFHPHITMARKWKGPGSIYQDNMPQASTLDHTFEVREAVLFETHLNKMPKYEEKENFPLV